MKYFDYAIKLTSNINAKNKILYLNILNLTKLILKGNLLKNYLKKIILAHINIMVFGSVWIHQETKNI